MSIDFVNFIHEYNLIPENVHQTTINDILNVVDKKLQKTQHLIYPDYFKIKIQSYKPVINLYCSDNVCSYYNLTDQMKIINHNNVFIKQTELLKEIQKYINIKNINFDNKLIYNTTPRIITDIINNNCQLNIIINNNENHVSNFRDDINCIYCVNDGYFNNVIGSIQTVIFEYECKIIWLPVNF